MEAIFDKLFIGGDLSGIQKFLYNISSRKAAVSLKGRSAYLSRYMENVKDSIIQIAKVAGAEDSKDVYCSGGKFYIITDNKPSVVNAIHDFSLQAISDLWKDHFGQLSLCIACEPFTENEDGTVQVRDLNNAPSSNLWRFVNNEFARQKTQKFKPIIETAYNEFFNPLPVGGTTKVCAITGVESDQCLSIRFKGTDEPIYVLPSVKEQIELGESIKEKEGNNKTFEDYAGNSYLGVLRMDVDGLGSRFIQGFKSIDKYQEFSKRLKDFFEDGVKQIQRGTKYKDYSDVIYAGGDDLFIVGRWDVLIDLAEEIHEKTKENFADENISISGGMVVVNPKYPIAKAAEGAGEAEEAAKSFRNGEKNAFHFLGRTVSWVDEFETVKEYQKRFCSLINEHDISKGILHKLMLYAAMSDENKRRKADKQSEDYSYLWHASYYLTRYMKRYDKDEEVQKFCQELRDKVVPKDESKLQLVALAARWAELLLRENTNN